MAKIEEVVVSTVENVVGKGENAGYQHFLLFPQCFHSLLSQNCKESALSIKRSTFLLNESVLFGNPDEEDDFKKYSGKS